MLAGVPDQQSARAKRRAERRLRRDALRASKRRARPLRVWCRSLVRRGPVWRAGYGLVVTQLGDDQLRQLDDLVLDGRRLLGIMLIRDSTGLGLHTALDEYVQRFEFLSVAS